MINIIRRLYQQLTPIINYLHRRNVKNIVLRFKLINSIA